MNVHRLEFLWKGEFGRLVLAGIAFFLVVGAVIYWKGRHPKAPAIQSQAGLDAQASRSTVTTLDNDIPVFHPAPPPAVQPPAGQKPAPANLPTSLMAFAIADTPHLSGAYAAYGRLIRCKLSITVDSNRIQTPILGVVLEDVYSVDHELVVPAMAEIHGMAQLDSAEERIGSQNQWVIVWRKDGREVELPLQGIALDHTPTPDGTGWSITDGSAGLRGQVIRSDNFAEIKAMLAEFGAGFAQSMAQNEIQSAITGNGTVITQQNNGIQQAVAQGAENAANLYAQQILDTIKRDGVFVRVPAGTDFYLYVTQTIDAAQARVGASIGMRVADGTQPKP